MKNAKRSKHENDFDDLIVKYAKQYNIEPALLKAFIRVESNFDKNAKNKSSTASGLMQFLKNTSKSYGVKNPFDPEQAINGGAHLIKDLHDKYNGDIVKIASAYRYGVGAVKKGKIAVKYAADIKKYYNSYKKSLKS